MGLPSWLPSADGPLFSDRFDAGRRLAARFQDLAGDSRVLVLAIPRGGVEVGYALASVLQLPLDVFITRKIPAPGNPELALGAVAPDGTLVLDQELLAQLGVPKSYIEAETRRQLEEIQRRLEAYASRPLDSEQLAGRRLLVVDDGVATGSTLTAGLRALRRQEPAELMVGIPVGPRDTILRLREEVDRLECLATPEPFWAVGRFYESFSQTSDAEVLRLLQLHRRSLGS